MKKWQVAVIVAALSAPIYIQALSNGWVLDDNIIVRRNEAAHSLPAAWKATLSPYWPVTEAGQYRPLVVWTYAVDWTISGGSPAWFHATNVVLHALAAALLALVLLRWLSPVAAIGAGVIFAWHPVHVEAVANVVGRAELLTAIGLLGAVLAGRRYRVTPAGRRRIAWGALVLGCVLVALLSKEHGVVALALIAADQALEGESRWKDSTSLYVMVIAVTIAWFYTWWFVAGPLAAEVVAAPVSGLSFGERLMTMLPAQLDVVRLLAWPSNLAADYSPAMIPQRREITWMAVVGLMTTAAILALGPLLARRAPVVAFGIVLSVATYAPTSNLLFASGVPLAERNLYLAAVVTAAVVGWLLNAVTSQRMRIAVAGVIGILAVGYAVRSVGRVPFWADDQTAVIDEFVSHPENYRNHLRLATMLVDRGDTLAGLAQGLVAARIFPEDPWVAWRVVPWALGAGWNRLAHEEATRAANIQPSEPAFRRLLTRVAMQRGRFDAALGHSRHAVALAPNNAAVWRWYAEVLDSTHAVPWRKTIVEAHLDWIEGRFDRAEARLSDVLVALRDTSSLPDCWEVEIALPLLAKMNQATVRLQHQTVGGPGCALTVEDNRP